MTPEYIQKLPEYYYEIDRIKLRFNGTGPRLHERTDKIWPRDFIDPVDECRKILHPDLIKLIDNDQHCQRIESIIIKLFTGLKVCNIMSLFNRFCSPDYDYNSGNFKTVDAMNAYSSHIKILDLIHHTIRGINMQSSCHSNFVKVLFGSNRNYDIYKFHLKWLVTGNLKMRKMTLGYFVHFKSYSMDLSKVIWLEGLNDEAKYRVFIMTISALTRFISELLRRYFYITISNPYANKLLYYRYDLWQRLYDRTIDHYCREDTLCKFEIDGSVKLPTNGTSKMKFYLKRDNLRLICTKQKMLRTYDQAYNQLRVALTYVLNKQPNHHKFSLNNLLKALREFRKLSIEHNKPIYFVRADFEDCFHSINQEKLRYIIMKSLRDNLGRDVIQLTKLACTPLSFRQKNGHREFSKWIVGEPVSCEDVEYFDIEVRSRKFVDLKTFDQDYVRPQIVHPVLRDSKNSKLGYNLMTGIRQGSPFSPTLCAIYLQSAFNENLADLLKASDCKLFRYVDDMLFMTLDEAKGRQFALQMSRGFQDYNLKTNVNKLACNFDCSSFNGSISRLKDFVVFYKRRICLSTLECSYDFSYNHITIDNTFLVSPYLSEEAILNSILKLSRIEAIHLDVGLNGINRVIENIFEFTLLVAYRTATLLICSVEFSNHNNQQPELLRKLILRISRRILNSLQSGLDRKLIICSLSSLEIRLLTTAAFNAAWSIRRVRHRKIEVYKIKKIFERFMMKYITTVRDDLADQNTIRGRKFEIRVRQLIKEFPKTTFKSEVLLPDKCYT